MKDLIIGGLALIASLIFALFMIVDAGVNASNVIQPREAFIELSAIGVVVSIVISIYFFYRFYRYDKEDVVGTRPT